MTISHRATLLITILSLMFASPAFALLGFGETKEPDEKERQETIERIEDVQDKLKLLQEKLKALERRKAAKEAAERAAKTGEPIPTEVTLVNWLPVDDSVITPGNFGIYTYLLFIGDTEDTAAIGSLEDLILTIETLPNSTIPEGQANRFLIPVEKPQSMVNLGRQPYDYNLNKAYLNRLQLRDSLPKGPVLVSLKVPIDPYGDGDVPAFLAVSLGRQKPEKALDLTKVWHDQEKEAVDPVGHPVADLFWNLLEESGPTRVTKFNQRVLVELPTLK